MTKAKSRKEKEEQSSLHGCISKNAVVKKSMGGKRVKISVIKDDSVQCGSKSPTAECNAVKGSTQGMAKNLHSIIDQGDQEIHAPSKKIKLQLFPIDEKLRTALEKDGHNPFLELTLSRRKRIASVVARLGSKWGSSSIAKGEVMLFPFNIVVENFTSYSRWNSSDSDIRAEDVHSAVGSPEIFRLRYGWVFAQPSSSPSRSVSGQVENGRSHEAAYDAENQAEERSNEVCNVNGSRTESIKQITSFKPLNLSVHLNQGASKCEILKPSNSTGTENGAAMEESSPVKPVTHEEARMDRELSHSSGQSLLWSDLSNISIGGLLSEASLQGRFNIPGVQPGNNSTSLPSASGCDSMDAFINHLNSMHSSTNHPPGAPSSIFDAEETNHSFAFPKNSSKDFLSLGRGAFSGISAQDTSSRSFKCSKLEGNEQNGSNVVQEPIAEPLPRSAVVYNNENSLGLSSIRWNDSLGPFDLPLIPRQIIKDDSVSIGGFVREKIRSSVQVKTRRCQMHTPKCTPEL